MITRLARLIGSGGLINSVTSITQTGNNGDSNSLVLAAEKAGYLWNHWTQYNETTSTAGGNYASRDYYVGAINHDEHWTITAIFTASASPVLANGSTLNYTENDSASQVNGSITVNDADTANLQSATVQITGNFQSGGEDILSYTSSGGIGGSFSTDTGILSLSGSASLADYQSVLQSVKYQNTSENPSTSARTVSFTVNDGATSSNTVTSTINVAATNDDPSIASLPSDVTVTEDTASNVNLSTATFSDVDSSSGNVVLTITAGSGTLAATSGGSVTVGGSGSAALTLTGTAANIDTFLNTASNIKYTSASNVNGNDATTLTLKANDGGNTGSGGGNDVALGTVNVDITAVNDDPEIASLPSDVTVTEDTASNVNLSAATFSDVDSAGSDVVLTITAGSGTLAATSGGSVTVGGSGSAALTLTGTAANIDTFLNTASNIKYTSASNVNGNDATTLTLKANDGGNTGSGGGNDVALGTVNVDITAVNDDPEIASLPTDVTVIEDTASNVNLSAAIFSDVDSSSGNVVLTITAGSGTLAATSGGSVTVGGSGSAALTLTGTAANIDTFLNTASNIKYTSASNVNGNDATTLTLKANDGGNTGSGGGNDVALGTVNVDITSVSDAPSGSDKTITMNEDATQTLAATDFGFSDATDAGSSAGADSFVKVKITTLESAGALKLNGVDVILNQEITVTDIGNNLLTFAPAAQANGAGYANFKFAVIDDGNGVTEDATPNTITFDVTSVSDAPSGSDKTITMNEDATQTLAATDFGFSDATDAGSSAGADSFVKVKITTLESAGALKLNGVDVILNQEITVTDIGNNLLTFAPAAQANGAGYANFKFAVIDDGNGVTEDATPNTITFDVTSVSDAPSGSDKTITMNEDATQTLAATDFGFSDATDAGSSAGADSFVKVKITTLESAGALKLNGVDVILNQEITVTDIGNNLLTFAPAAQANGAGYANFKFAVIDDGNGVTEDATPNTITFDVTSVSDAPSGSDKTITMNEDATQTLAATDFGFQRRHGRGQLRRCRQFCQGQDHDPGRAPER